MTPTYGNLSDWLAEVVEPGLRHYAADPRYDYIVAQIQLLGEIATITRYLPGLDTWHEPPVPYEQSVRASVRRAMAAARKAEVR